jgi:large subunit ribosomal protein L25
MATATDTTTLTVAPREVAGSRATRRLRRTGQVPGIVYGGGDDPIPFSVEARELRNVLAHTGAVIELRIGDGKATPVVLKELVRHPVSGYTVHLDFLRVRMDRALHSMVVLDLTGADDAPGVKSGGVLEQTLRELSIEALPGDIPDTIEFDVSNLEMGATLTVAELTPPAGVTLLDDPETVVASITAPRLQLEDENEIEQETGVVGEGETPADTEGEADADTGDASETTSE